MPEIDDILKKLDKIYTKLHVNEKYDNFIRLINTNSIVFTFILAIIALIQYGILGVVVILLVIYLSKYIIKYCFGQTMKDKAAESDSLAIFNNHMHNGEIIKTNDSTSDNHLRNNENITEGFNSKKPFSKNRIIMYLMLLILIYVLYINFESYFAKPEITITSTKFGDTIQIDKDNSFSEIYGTSKNLACNKFFHLNILYRRIDSDKRAGEWNFDDDFNPCTLYNDGTWECRIQLKKLFAEWINGTLIVRQPTKNISTNVDIIAVITRNLIDPESRRFEYDSYGTPEHLIDDHVRIIPFIPEPFNLTGNPYGLLLTSGKSQDIYYTQPLTNKEGKPLGDVLSIPADNVTNYCINSQVIDIAGNSLQLGGKIINFTINKGNLTDIENITNSQGRASVCIISGELGSGSLLAESAGLHNATLEIAFTLPAVVLDFNHWINSSSSDKDRLGLTANFQTINDGKYNVILTGSGTEAHWPFKPKEWPLLQVDVDGIIFKNITISESRMKVGNLKLNKGNHILKLNMTNNFQFPLIGSRNIYIDRIEFLPEGLD
jgi:hypothetical protein